MDGSYDIAIVGAGLAGATAALSLSERYKIVVLEKDAIASGASGAAAGIVNPFMARRARPTWEWRPALEALTRLLNEAGLDALFDRRGILRPALDEEQARWFRNTALEFPSATRWMTRDHVYENWPAISAQFGALRISEGGSVPLVPVVEGLLAAADRKGATVAIPCTLKAMEETQDGVRLETSSGSVLVSRVLLCTGSDFARWPDLAPLPLHLLKGQTICVTTPEDFDPQTPVLSGSGYLVTSEERLILGSTYHHEFVNGNPTAADTAAILEKVGLMYPAVTDSRLISETAGIRVTVRGNRLPMVGAVTGSGNVWVFTGLGSKGLLMAPFVAQSLCNYIENPHSIPDEIQVR